ncbi:rhodanese-like domain-containing protein [Paracoccus onubensis]|uniref:Rhodanese-related sulfurtransferase n=1 Tax=Paracoccus onubensis TaxID=1675788 RepID=A0A418T7C5_9RHOB|nr:rhodanese-like domain-containing protein [Paracoccus onubensis]RJE89102.1 rhodanese-related sulfurtransferase [Paracoccus onubensis]
MTRTITPEALRSHWLNNREIALIDVREEYPYSRGHAFFALSVPLSEIETRLPALIPRLAAPVAVIDNGEGYAEPAAARIEALGYEDVAIVDGGLAAYAELGEIYIDVNVPSKAFGELVETIRHTPSLPAEEVKRILETEKDIVVLDVRRFEEFNTMSIPGGQSAPGGELVYRVNDLVASDDTTVIVNCAGRTRSIIGTQSLINSGLKNPVYALRNGTIGWTLAGQELAHGRTERARAPSAAGHDVARRQARQWAAHVGVPEIPAATLLSYRAEAESRTLYQFDVRTPEEYAEGHPAGFASAPGGQLVQATDEWVGVRGARIVLYDSDGVRARMTASWLHQMGWDVSVLAEGETPPATDDRPVVPDWSPVLAAGDLVTADTDLTDAVFADLARYAVYSRGHVPGAWYISGNELARDLARLPGTGPIILTSPDGNKAAANLAAARAVTSRPVRVLKGGTAAWKAQGYPFETEARHASDPIDAYTRPYEGTDSPKENMRAYIEWELQLNAQMANDGGISRFRVVRGEPSDQGGIAG